MGRRRRKRRREEAPCGTCIRGRGKKAGQVFFFFFVVGGVSGVGANGRRGRDLSPVATIHIQSVPVSSPASRPPHHTPPRPAFHPLIKATPTFMGSGKTEQVHGDEEEGRFLKDQGRRHQLIPERGRQNYASEAHSSHIPHMYL